MSGSDDRRRRRRCSRSRSRSRSRPDRRSRNRQRSRRRDSSYSPPRRPSRDHYYDDDIYAHNAHNVLPQQRKKDTGESRCYREALAAGLDSDQDNIPYDGQPAYERPASVLRVENLPSDVDDDELRELFSKVPGVVSIVPQRAGGGGGKGEPCIGYAVLAMKTVAAAQELMDTQWRDNAYYKQHNLRLTYSNSDPRSLPHDEADWVCPSCLGVNYARRLECYKCRAPRTVDCQAVDAHAPSNIIKIGNLGPTVTEETLEFAVKPVAPVKEVRVSRDRYTGECRGHAILTFFNEKDAKLVMEKLDGTRLSGERWSLRMSYIHTMAAGGVADGRERLEGSARDGYDQIGAHQTAGGNALGVGTEEDAVEWEPKSFEELAAEAAAEEAAATATAADEPAMHDVFAVPQGFDYDVNTGYHRDPVSGYLYDTTTKYYFHPLQQEWGTRNAATGEFIPIVVNSATFPTEDVRASRVEVDTRKVYGATNAGGGVFLGSILSRVYENTSDSSAVIGAAPQLNQDALAEARLGSTVSGTNTTSAANNSGSNTRPLKGVIHRGKWAQRMQQRSTNKSNKTE